MERPENSSHKIDIACSQVPEEKVWRVVQLADQIVSQKSLDTIELKKGTLFAETLQRLGVNLSYHKVSMIRGITTQLLHNGVMMAFQNHGWTLHCLIQMEQCIFQENRRLFLKRRNSGMCKGHGRTVH